MTGEQSGKFALCNIAAENATRIAGFGRVVALFAI
jgi:hypothetical protein